MNVVSFHDPVIIGANMEDTDLYEWTRRPGFSIFCPTPLPDSEIANQFYSSRILDGVVLPFVDTSRRLATFSSTAITTIVAKTTPNQGYIETIGNMTYFADGAAADYYALAGTSQVSIWGLAAPTTTPVASGMGFWQAYKKFSLGNAILDPNGDVEVVTAILIPNGSFESPTVASTLALGGSLPLTWEYDSVHGGYETTQGYQHIQQASSGSAATTTVTVMLPLVTTMGNVIVISFGSGTENFVPTVVSVTDNLGNTYTQQATGTGDYMGGGGNVYNSTAWVWTAPVTAAGSTTITVVLNTNVPELQVAAHEFAGISDTATTSASAFNFNSSSINSGTVTFSGTQLVLSSLLLFNTGSASTPFGYQTGEAHAIGEWQLDDAYLGATSPQSPTWFFPANGQALGISTVFAITAVTTGYTPYLFLSSFKLGVPAGSTIVGIVVTIPKMNAGTGTVTDYSVKLVYGGTVVGASEADAVTSWSTAGYAVATYGSPTDTWSASLTAADINTNGLSGFGVAISANITDTTGGSVTPEVGFDFPNQATVTVYFKQSSGLGGPGISGAYEPTWPTLTNGTVNDGGITWTDYGPILQWLPATYYPAPAVILDPNGNLQLVTYVPNLTPPWDDSTGYTLGQVVYFGGQYWISVFNGTNTGVVPTVQYATTGSSTTVPYWALTTTPTVTGLTVPVWNTTIGGTTDDGSYTWTNIGQGTALAFTGYDYVYNYRTVYGHLTTGSQYSNNTGAILGPVNATITQFQIAVGPPNIITFYGTNNFIPGNVFQVSELTSSTGLLLNEQSFTVISAIPSSTFPLTAVAVDGSDVLTITAVNNLVAGQQVTFSGVGTATWLNGLSVVVSATGLSASQFEATGFTAHGSYGPTADVGNVNANGSYTAVTTVGGVGLTLDEGVGLPLIATLTGIGTGSPLCNSVATITAVSVLANVATITASNNFQPGIFVTITGLTGAAFLNNQQFEVIAVDQSVGTQNTYFQIFLTTDTPNYAQTADAGLATFNAIEIYRISDGGGIYLFDGAVTNPGANISWTYNDFVPDANLDIALVSALSHQNDPPPGAPGSTITPVGTIIRYWQGRLWMVVGHYVYFDAGPDCTNGIPEQSWPPSNRFQFAGPVLGLEPTADGVGLIVMLADRYNMILGGPETISFYPTDALSNFGISNPNAMFRDGSTIGQFTTQKQYFDLIDKQKQETGEHIADYLTANFDADSTYVTMHRNGLDVGIFLSNGDDQVLRYGSNISAWSVPAYPACGAGALRSIETTVGINTLMLASPTGGVTTTIGLINPGSGISTGIGTVWVDPANITVGSPTSYATVTFATAGVSQVLRASAYVTPPIPRTAVVQGIQVTIVGKQTDITSDLTLTITPTNPAIGAESHTFSFGNTNTTFVFGSALDTWGMPWNLPLALNAGAISFDIVATYTGGSTPEVYVAEVQVAVTYQNPGNYLYARDVNSWGDCGTFGANNGTPYAECNVVIGSITLSQLGGRLFPLQHVVGYFDAVGTLNNGAPSQPDIWILPNEVNATAGIGFIQLPEVLQEPPTGQNKPSATILALRYPVNMMNSYLASQFMHHLQVRVQFEPENAPNTLKAIAFMEDQAT